jgi:hypothetical protein
MSENYLHQNKIVNPNAYIPTDDVVSFLQQVPPSRPSLLFPPLALTCTCTPSGSPSTEGSHRACSRLPSTEVRALPAPSPAPFNWFLLIFFLPSRPSALPVALDELYPKKKGKDQDHSESESDSDSEDSEFDLDPDIQLMEVKVH